MRRLLPGVAAVAAAVIAVPLVLEGVAPAEQAEGATDWPAVVLDQAKITAGSQHTCALLDNGTIRCWGYNDHGQLGNGSRQTTNVPQPVTGITTAVQVTAGAEHTCALLHDGTVLCWGLNGNGQVGDGTTTDRTTPAAVAGLADVVSIAAGSFHTCAVRAGGAAVCWGSSSSGQLGDGSTAFSSTPVPVAGLDGTAPAAAAVGLAGGEFHTCALRADATIACWGSNGFGQLGDGTTTDRLTPVAVVGLPDAGSNAARSVAAGNGHTCALLDDGSARCWGLNAFGQLGNDTETDSASPVTAKDLADAVAISAGTYHTCALRSDGTGRCWGQNGRGQVGNIDPINHPDVASNRKKPVEVTGLAGAQALTTGGFHTCAVVAGVVGCWGYDFFGQLGQYVSSSSRPVTVTAMADASTVTSGERFACALVGPANAPRCWGDNADGRLGLGSFSPASTTTSYPVAGLAGSAVIDAGAAHACALVGASGDVRCWGRNDDGQLGNNSFASSASPVPVSGISTAILVEAGGDAAQDRYHSCARLSDGTVRCWGDDSFGQLGDDDPNNGGDSAVPVTVDGISTAVDVAVGGTHTCALLADGSVRCWGHNNAGQVGDDTTDDRDTPVSVVDLGGAASAVVAGRNHTCAIVGTKVRCWGANGSGQLGDNSTTTRKKPVDVAGIPFGIGAQAPVALTAGADHTCALLADSDLVCWGEGSAGQLGNGASSDEDSPVQVDPGGTLDPPPGNQVTTVVSAGTDHTCARLVDTTVNCWGSNATGQLGDGVDGATFAPGAATLPLGGGVGGNTVPTPRPDSATTDPGVNVTVAVLTNDTDADGDMLTISANSDPPHGQVVSGGPGSLTYIPDPGFCGIDSFTYTVTDGTASSSTVVTITVTCPNSTPAPLPDAYTTVEDTPVAVSVLDNDTDPDGGTLTVQSTTDPPKGSVAVAADGTGTYTPDPDTCGTDTFGYTVSDGQGGVASTTVTISVSCVNDAPVAVDDTPVVGEDSGPTMLDVAGNDTDADGDTLVATSVSDPPHGSALVIGGFVRYTPDTDYCGADAFTYVVSDGNGGTDTAQVSVTVSCAPDGPTAVDDTATTTEDTAVVVPVLVNDFDPDGDTLTIASVTQPAHGSATITDAGTTITYTPEPDYCSADQLTYTITDGTSSSTAVLNVVGIICTPDAPVAVDDVVSTDEDTSVPVDVLANDSDPDGQALSVTGLGNPANGSVIVAPSGIVTYTPALDWCGLDSFTYTVGDGTGSFDTATVTVTVTCVNDAPSVDPVAAQATPWGSLLTVLVSGSDPDGTALSWALGSGPAGVVVDPVSGTVTWTPLDADVGTHTVTLEASDGALAATRSFTVVVTRRTPVLSVPTPTSGQHSDPVVVSAHLTDGGQPVVGRPVTLAVGPVSAVAVTDVTGTAQAALVLDVPAGPTTVSATLAADAAYVGTASTAAFTVTPEAATLTFAGSSLVLVTSSTGAATLSASVAEEPDGSPGNGLAGATVTFTEVAGGPLCTAVVSLTAPGTGTASCTTAPLGLGTRAVVAAVAGGSHRAPVDVGVLTVAQSPSGSAVGAASVDTGTGRVDVGFRALPGKKGPLAGEVVSVHRDAGTALVVRSSSLSSLSRTCSGGKTKVCTATVQAGAATTTTVDLATGAVGPPSGSSAVRVDATDRAEPTAGTPVPADAVALTITGTTSFAAGTATSPLPIVAGNVRVP